MIKHLPRTPLDILFITLVGVCIVGIIVSIVQNPATSGGVAVDNPQATTTVPFKNINLTAKAAIVWDIKNHREIYQKNADEILPLASLTKMMTALVALENASSTSKITFDANSLLEEGDSGLLVDEEWKLKTLIDFTLVSSSNDGARAIATAIEAIKPGQSFVSRMNAEATSRGFTGMTFENPTGLDVNPSLAGGYGSARQIALLYQYILEHYPDIFEYTSETRAALASKQFMHTAVNTNTAIDNIPGIFASKTGTSDLAGGNLAVMIDIGLQQPVALVVLGSTPEGRFQDIVTLEKETRSFIALGK